MTTEELQAVLNEHEKWLRGTGGKRANLWGSEIWGANLKGVDLGGANLMGANLKGANLGGANLKDADVRGADIRGANLWCAILRGADLRDADLRGANLWGANLKDADLKGAALWCPNLWGSDLGDAMSPSELKSKIRAALSSGGKLEMKTWHTCQTTHCIAGWAVVLHPNGKELEEATSTATAGRILLGLLGRGEDNIFYASNDEALAWLNSTPEKEDIK